jgi:tetratricopeptide (TPR) repeat protein
MLEELTVDQLIARGKEFFARNAYIAALGDLEEAAGRQPGFADVHNLVGLCRSLVGRPESAADSFERAVQVNPEYVEAHLNLAITLNELGRFDEAKAAFERAAEADVERSTGRFSSLLAARLALKHAELGDLYAEGGGLQEAAEQYGMAADLRPRFVDIRNRLARTLLELGDHEGALRELEHVLDINPAFADARANLGLAHFRRGDVDRAEEEWQRCLTQRPGHPQVQSYLGMLQRHREAADAT